MDRRAALGLTAAAAAAALAGGVAGAQPSAPAASARAYRRIRLRDDERAFFWWMSGSRYAQVDNALTQMFDIEILSILRVEGSGADRFTLRSLEMVFNRGPDGTLLERWVNPLTGEALTPAYRPVGPVVTPYVDGVAQPPAPLPGMRVVMQRPPRRLLRQGDSLFLRDDSQAEVLREGAAPYRVNDFAEYHALARDVDGTAPFIPATVAFTAVTGWQRWWNMGDRPGGSVARAMGRKVEAWADVPAFTRAAVARLYPAIAADPAAARTLPPFRFER
jgi:hypothetical protein